MCIVFTLILGGCVNKTDTQKVKEELMRVDRAFSNDIGYTHGKYELIIIDSTAYATSSVTQNFYPVKFGEANRKADFTGGTLLN